MWNGAAHQGSDDLTTELWMLLASAILMQAMPFVYGPGFIQALGPEKMVGNRDNMPPIEGWFARARRAHGNIGENLVPFMAVVLVANAAGVHSDWTATASVVFFVARLAHFASYIVGIGMPRTISYVVGALATLVIAGSILVAR